MGRASGRKKRRGDRGADRGEQRRSGAHYTPFSLAEQIVETTLYPLLRWMMEDPEGWDRAHPAPAPFRPRSPHPIVPGCRCDPQRRFLDRECPAHGIEAEQRGSRLGEQRSRAEPDPLPPLLRAMLELAVPQWMERLRPLDWAERMKRRDHCLRLLCTGEGGDLAGVARLVCGEPGKGVAEAFNALAEGLALGALQPGGVTFCGIHWEAADRAA